MPSSFRNVIVVFFAATWAAAASADLNFVDKSPLADAKPTGDQIFLLVEATPDSVAIDPGILKHVEDHALSWLKGRGYKVQAAYKKVHTFVMLGVYRAQGGHTEDITLVTDSYENGRPPLRVNYSQYNNRAVTDDNKFLADPKELDEAVDGLLKNSLFGKADKAPSPSKPEDPGCWYMMGIGFDTKPMRDGLFFIKNLPKDSLAKDAGLRELDQVVEVNGEPLTLKNFPPVFKKGDRPKLTYIRNYQRKSLTLPVTYKCIENPGPKASSTP